MNVHWDFNLGLESIHKDGLVQLKQSLLEEKIE